MNVLPIEPATPATVAAAAQLLREGKLVAFPTETVYGLGADATSGLAVAGIFEAKGRPRFNPLIVHVPDLVAAESLAELNPTARRLAAAFWPGPLTLVLKQRPDCRIADLTTAGLETIAIRVPSHPVARSLLNASGIPIAAPSANRSGHVSATTAEHVEADLGAHVALILDGGPADAGVESTILDASGDEPLLLRPGAVTVDAIESIIGTRLGSSAPIAADKPTAPGQLESHYAPHARVRLDAHSAGPGEALLAFGRGVPAHHGSMINLSAAGDLKEAAANLFSALRALDRPDVTGIAVMPIPETSLGLAINDRLRRAAAPR